MVTESRVAIIIRCYDTDPELLGEAFHSAASQQCEVIVVDDGSTRADTRAYLGDLGVRVISTSNRGPAAALNSGVAATNCEYIVALDSDDRLGPGYVSRLADFLDNNPNVPVACSAWKEFGERDGLVVPPYVTTGVEMVEKCTILASSMFRRADWVVLGGLCEERGIFEDWEWWARLLLAKDGEARRVDGALYHYRIHKRSLNIKNYTGVDTLIKTRQVMLRDNPGVEHAVARILATDIAGAYQLGQMHSPIAEAATAQARYWASRYGKIEGARRRVLEICKKWPR